MSARPARREVLGFSGAACAVVAGAIVAATVSVGSIPTPTYAVDAPVVSALIPVPGDLPGWHSLGSEHLRQSQVVSNPALVPDQQILSQDRGCAFFDGPTDPGQLTAVAADAFGIGSNAAGAELFGEAITYRTAAPVEADMAAAGQPGIDACVARLLATTAGADQIRSTADLRPVSLGGGLGNVRTVALAGTWSTFGATPGIQTVGTLHVEVVLITHSRGEVVIVAEDPDGPVPQAAVDHVAARSARALQARLA